MNWTSRLYNIQDVFVDVGLSSRVGGRSIFQVIIISEHFFVPYIIYTYNIKHMKGTIKLSALSIFLILLFVIVFSMIFKTSWDSMTKTEGFALGRDTIFGNLYYNYNTHTVGMSLKNGSDMTLIEPSGDGPATQVKKIGGRTMLYVPHGEDIFIHVLSQNHNNFQFAQFIKGTQGKIVKTFQGQDRVVPVTTQQQSLDKMNFNKVTYVEDASSELKTFAEKSAEGNMYAIAMKYGDKEVLVVYEINDNNEYTIHKDRKRTTSSESDPESEESKEENIHFKMGDYEITLPQSTAENLAASLGSRIGSSFGGSSGFMQSSDYNNEYIRKTEVVPGFGYDYHNYDVDERIDRRRRTGGGYYDSDIGSEPRVGERDSEGNLLSDFGEGTASLLRDGAKGTADLARDTARGAANLTKETVGGVVDLGKETVGGAVDLGKETVGGATGLARETVGGATGLAKDTVGGATGLAKDTVGGATGLAKDTASGVSSAIGNTLSGTGDFIQSSASGIGNFAKDAAGGTVGLAKDAVGGTVGLGREIVGGVGSALGGVGGALQSNPTYIGGGQGGQVGGYGGGVGRGGQVGGYGGGVAGGQGQTHGMNPYSYNGAVPPRPSCNFIPRTADFSAFGR